MRQKTKLGLSGALAGLVNGLFGGGGGMVMVPLLTAWCGLEQKRALATCVAVILPFCVLSAAIYVLRTDFDWLLALPYLIGGGIGGALCVAADNDYEKTLENGAELAAYLLWRHGLTPDDLRKHQDFSGKICPARLINEGRWDEFCKMVRIQYEKFQRNE